MSKPGKKDKLKEWLKLLGQLLTPGKKPPAGV
jgi:hypothetical protein